MFIGKNILIGITGGIAVYKTADLIREFKKNGAYVRVVMTKAATKFVSPLTFETLSENKVLLDLFPLEYGEQTAHIDWARWADIILICPATLNTIGKIASGIADNALSTTIMAATVPVLFCPAMNKAMYANSIFQENLKKLTAHGYSFVDPGIGELACGEEGYGRLADKKDIIAAVEKILFSSQELNGKKIVVTAGPTEEPLDPVRYLTNRSSGKMGFAIARQAALHGAHVVLISGPTVLEPFSGVHLIKIRTADEMERHVTEQFKDADVLIMAAAVSDYKPAQYSSAKLKKEKANLDLALVKNTDILAQAGKSKGKRIVVGFSVETELELENSRKKLKAKNCDFIVINNPNDKGAGFRNDTNLVTVLDNNEHIEKYPLLSKNKVAEKLINKIVTLIKK